MLEDIFKKSLNLSSKLRPEYPQSLGLKYGKWEDIFKNLNFPIPELFAAIYNNVSGTKRSVEEQQLMDFVPGYRLIHISELIGEKDTLDSILENQQLAANEIVFPLLVNYSSDFICYCMNNNGEEKICILMNDSGELILMYNSPCKFLETICEFYTQGVYFLDSERYLDYDIDKESIIGARMNPGINYWME